VQLITDIGQVIVVALGFAGGIKFLEANDVGVLGPDEFQHFGSVAGSAFLFSDIVVKAADIPGEYAQCMRWFCSLKAIARMEGPEAMDIGPAEYQGDQGHEGPAAAGGKEKTENKEDQYDKEQKGKYEAQQGDKPPSTRMQEGVGAGQQEKDDRNYVRDDEQAA
jgi:hypothetical protein